MTKLPELFECHRLRAKITERQCKLNREGYRTRGLIIPSIGSCLGCPGLGNSASVPTPTEISTMATNIKKYVCIEEGCHKHQSKNHRCHIHNKEYLQKLTVEKAEKAGTVIHDVNNLDIKPAVKTVISDNIAPEPLHFAADGLYLTACGVVSSSRTLLTTNWDAVTCENCLLWKQLNESPAAELDQVSADSFDAEWVRNDELAQAMLSLIGCTVGLELLADQPDDQIRAAMDYAGACHLQASDNDDVELPPMPFFLKGTQTHAPESQNQPVAGTPPQEQVRLCVEPESALARLLRPILPPPPPLPITSIVLDFDEYEFSAIQSERVTIPEIKSLVLKLIAGELGIVIQVEDPLAKSRQGGV